MCLASSVELEYKGNRVHVTMLPNPSHLEVLSSAIIISKNNSLYHCSIYIFGFCRLVHRSSYYYRFLWSVTFTKKSLQDVALKKPEFLAVTMNYFAVFIAENICCVKSGLNVFGNSTEIVQVPIRVLY